MVNWKGCGKKWTWPNVSSYDGIGLEGPRACTKDSAQDVGAQAETRTALLLGTSQKRERSSQVTLSYSLYIGTCISDYRRGFDW
jgi:hypothetical protein